MQVTQGETNLVCNEGAQIKRLKKILTRNDDVVVVAQRVHLGYGRHAGDDLRRGVQREDIIQAGGTDLTFCTIS